MNAAFDLAGAAWDAEDRGGEERERHEAAQRDPRVRRETEQRAKLKRGTDGDDGGEDGAKEGGVDEMGQMQRKKVALRRPRR